LHHRFAAPEYRGPAIADSLPTAGYMGRVDFLNAEQPGDALPLHGLGTFQMAL
jgi:hypothetical protein